MKKAAFIIAALAILIILLLVLGRKNLSTEIVIDAPAGRVWREFIDTGSYPQWNPFIRKVTGALVLDGKIHVSIQPKDDSPMDFNPTILAMKENEMLQWEGRLFLPGIFTGTHTFQLSKIDGETTKFIQKEEFSGILVPFFDLGPTLEGFKSMNAVLKERAEKK